MIVVADDIVVAADYLLRKAKVTEFSRDTADQKADNIIDQTVISIAFTAFLPAAVNWAIMDGIFVYAILRIARVYGASLNKEEAGKLLTQLVLTSGTLFVVAGVGSKIISAAFQATGAGAPAGIAIDFSVSAAMAYAIGIATKAYFRGEPAKEIRKIMRSAFLQGRRKFSATRLASMRQEAKTVLIDYEDLHRIMTSQIGRDILDVILQKDPNIRDELNHLMTKKGLRRLEELSPEHLKAVDHETGLACHIWDMLVDATDMKLLSETAKAPTVDPAALRSYIRLREQGINSLQEQGITILPVMRSEASALDFPAGHPRDGVVYVGNPALSSVYYTAAHFHRLTFEHKFSEAIRILQHLGANSIEVLYDTGWSSEFAAKLNAGINFVSQMSQIGGDISGVKKARSYMLYKGTYRAGSSPMLPEDLVWYPHEPTWQQVAEGRLKHGMQDFSLDVRYEDDFGITMDLADKIRLLNAGFDLGGVYEEHQATVWRLVGHFSEST